MPVRNRQLAIVYVRRSDRTELAGAGVTLHLTLRTNPAYVQEPSRCPLVTSIWARGLTVNALRGSETELAKPREANGPSGRDHARSRSPHCRRAWRPATSALSSPPFTL
jgi:hypothetical protein